MRGWITDNQYHKNEKESGKLRLCGDAWSINLNEVLDKGITDIVYHTNKGRYLISYADAQAHGFVREFGGEQKLVVPVRHWQFDSLVLAQN